MKYVGGVKKVGSIAWQLKHEMIHVLIGVSLAWFLRELWGEFSAKHLYLAIIGSLIPDLDHFIFFFFYGRKDPYSVQVKKFLRRGQFHSLASFLAEGHKENTNLWSHNIYNVGLLLAGIFIFYQLDWKVGIILFAAMALHFVFDIVDDFVVLGTINPNWKRWGRPKTGRIQVPEKGGPKRP